MPDSELDLVARRFGLSRFERDVLMLSAAVELDGHVAGLVAELLQSDDPRPNAPVASSRAPGTRGAASRGAQARSGRPEVAAVEPAGGPSLA